MHQKEAFLFLSAITFPSFFFYCYHYSLPSSPLTFYFFFPFSSFTISTSLFLHPSLLFISFLSSSFSFFIPSIFLSFIFFVLLLLLLSILYLLLFFFIVPPTSYLSPSLLRCPFLRIIFVLALLLLLLFILPSFPFQSPPSPTVSSSHLLHPAHVPVSSSCSMCRTVKPCVRNQNW